jgi:hypothetical protein
MQMKKSKTCRTNTMPCHCNDAGVQGLLQYMGHLAEMEASTKTMYSESTWVVLISFDVL